MDQPSKFNPWMIATFVLAGIMIGFGTAQLPYFQKDAGKAQVAAVKTDEQAPADPILTQEQIAALPDDDPVKGDEKAPITLVEFSDFQCYYCVKFFKTILPLIVENYVNTGKVKIVYRDYPNTQYHPQSGIAATAAACALDQGKFWEMHDAIFDEQYDLMFGKQINWKDDAEAKKWLKNKAKSLSLDVKDWDSCMTSTEHNVEIQKDLLDGYGVGVDGTPAFFVDGKIVSGALPYEQFFKPIFDAELAGKKWTITKDARGNPTGVKVE